MKKKIVNWLKAEVRLAKAKGIILGLSGGIDSCVVAALAKEALGKNRVLGLILPIQSHTSDAIDAKIAAGKLGIRHKTVELSKIYHLLLKTFPRAGILARMNLKPRLRMLTLYYFANKLDYLVCGTGNKSELMVGYFTKYGDGGVDLLPIGDLLKRQVRSLAKELKIPRQIIEKTPTAGLWPGQTDEGEMGITYPELDDILSRLENKRRQILPLKKVNKVKAMIIRSGHKRIKPKVCEV